MHLTISVPTEQDSESREGSGDKSSRASVCNSCRDMDGSVARIAQSVEH